MRVICAMRLELSCASAITSGFSTRTPPLAIAPNASSSWCGHAELADEQYVERRTERRVHLVGHRDAAARKPEDYQVVAECLGTQLLGK